MAQSSIEVLIRKHEVLAKAIGVGVVGFFILMVAVVPSFNKNTELREEVKDKNSELDKLSQRVVVLTDVDEGVLDERITVLNRVLPPRKDIMAYLSTLDGLSRELNLSIGGFSVSPGKIYESSQTAAKKSEEPPIAGLAYLDTEITISGSEESIYEFLRQVENTSPLLKVSDIKMSRVNKEEGSPFNLSLQMAMLYAPATMDGKVPGGAIELFRPEEEQVYSMVAEFKYYDLPLLLQDSEAINEGRENIFSGPTQSQPEASLPTSSPQSSPTPQPQE